MSEDWTAVSAGGGRTLLVPAGAAPVVSNGHGPISEEPVRPSAPVSADRAADTDRRPPRFWQPWPTNLRIAVAGTCVVLLAMWAVSFNAIVDGAMASGIPFVLALACPLIVDGEMAIGTLALVSISRRVARRTRVYLGVLILLSVAVSMAANMAHPWTGWLIGQSKQMDGPWPYLASGVPSLWIALVVHQLVILWRHTPGMPSGDPAVDVAVPHRFDPDRAEGFRTRRPRRVRSSFRGSLGPERRVLPRPVPQARPEAPAEESAEGTAETSAEVSAPGSARERVLGSLGLPHPVPHADAENGPKPSAPETRNGARKPSAPPSAVDPRELPQSSRASSPKLDPKLARIARSGGPWREVQKAFPDLSDDAAQRRLAEARKQLGLNSRNRSAGIEGGA